MIDRRQVLIGLGAAATAVVVPIRRLPLVEVIEPVVEAEEMIDTSAELLVASGEYLDLLCSFYGVYRRFADTPQIEPDSVLRQRIIDEILHLTRETE